MPKKKKFIDKKNSVTFHLVHRSQKDPLAADERAPQHVLVPLGKKIDLKEKEPEKRFEEQRKFGIFFDDDYNYLQHLRDVNQTVDWEPVETFRIQKDDKLLPPPSEKDHKKITLPSSVFASNVEENVGLLNKAAPHSGPRLDLDPDIVAAMDEDFDFDDPDNMLDDDFIVKANANGSDEEDAGSDDDGDVGSEDGFGNASWDEEDDELGSLNGPCPFADEETKSKFTDYSMSSSVIRRNNQLTLLDDRFEKMFESYDDNEIGALECEEIEGDIAMDAGILAQCAEEFEQEQSRIALKDARKAAHVEGDGVNEDEESDDEEMEEIEVPDKEDKPWDCESILSTYSNLYNHPKLIKDNFGRTSAIKVSSKTGVPVGVLGRNPGLTAKGLAALDKAFADERGDDAATIATSVISQLSIRPKDETPEDRRRRKLALKNYRKERRVERKANTLAFKEEKKRQEKTMLSNKQNIFNVKVV